MASELNARIPTTKSRLCGVTTSKEDISQQILKLLKEKPYTPSQLTNHFHFKDRSTFSKNYLYPLRDSNLVIKVDGSNYYQLPKQKNSSKSIKEALRSSYEIFQTELFVNWKKKNHSKDEEDRRVRFANICMGFTNKNFSILIITVD